MTVLKILSGLLIFALFIGLVFFGNAPDEQNEDNDKGGY